jgi:curved DNA-binding protein CbpA
MKNYYKILEIETNADLLSIKKAYRMLALKYHPDKNPTENAAQMFIEITEAYEVLRNSESRKEYDALFKAFSKNATNDKQTKTEQNWQQYGREKATEYSSMHVDDFISRVVDEVKIGAHYGINFVLIGFCLFAVISVPTFFSIDPFIGIFCLFLYGGLGYLLFNRTKQDYQKDRKQKFNN